MPKLLALVGPTASGKTHLSILLAQQLNGEILSADSRQVYRYLNIGTAKPTEEERRMVPHHFVDFLEPSEEYSAGTFGHEARQRALVVFSRNKCPILVGGSGLYVKAVIDGFFEGPGKDPELREQLESQLSAEGPETLLSALEKIDPMTAGRMDLSKPRRIIRALEVYHITGKPLSEFHREQSTAPPFDIVQFGLQWERKSLYRRIDARVDAMLSAGLIEEVKGLRERGYGPTQNALNTVGYREVFEFLDGKITHDNMVDLIKRNTRRFAKRQLTWFRADSRIAWLRVDERIPLEEFVRGIVAGYRS
jgi:tRNA dimethylallyltransferase